jgi:hypothetical protein
MAYSEITGTDHDGLCEECDAPMTAESVTEGDLGFYCSEECREKAEIADAFVWREDFHADV